MRRLALIVFPMLMLTCGCGGAKGQRPDRPSVDDSDMDVKYTAEDMVPRAVLAKADLTTAVDAKRYRVAAPITTAFVPDEDIIYLVGRLKSVPTDSSIEVRWFIDDDPRPMLVSDVQGSDNFQFIASFCPQDARFVAGGYSARVFVNDEDIGGVSFVIGEPEAAPQGSLVSKVSFSTALRKNMSPKKASSKFKKGTRKLYLSFDVKGAEMNSVADVHWYRGGEEFHNSEIELGGNRRYAAHVESPDGLPDGEYRVEIYVAQQLQATKSVVIGTKAVGAAIDEIALGLTLTENNMPKKSMAKFRRDTSVIQCGLRFLDLPTDSVIEIQWVMLDRDGDLVLFKNRSNLPSGGSGTMGAAWELDHELDPGDYKVVVTVNDEPMGEEIFEII